jgi:hypothetical protein
MLPSRHNGNGFSDEIASLGKTFMDNEISIVNSAGTTAGPLEESPPSVIQNIAPANNKPDLGILHKQGGLCK